MNTRDFAATRRSGALVVAFLFFAVAAAGAQDATVSYLEGSPEIRRTTGRTEWLDFGMAALPGERITTGSADFVEMDQAGQATIRIQADTIFTIREVDQGGRKETVLSTAAGSVSYRFNQISGREPRVGTSTTVAGIRGTELTVYAGPDGSSLFLVDSGMVEVTSAGESVELTANEGVEVAAGQAPGEKFERLGREQDFSAWSAGRIDAFLADPSGVLDDIGSRLLQFSRESDSWYQRFLDAKVDSDAARETLRGIEGEEAQTTYREGTWLPLANQTAAAVLNYRYNALSAMSLRRYSLGNLYMEMKTRNIIEPSAEFDRFLGEYSAIIAQYHDMFDRYLEDADL